MSKSFFIAPTGNKSGLTSVCVGIFRALDNIGVRVGFFKPVSQEPFSITGETPEQDASIHFIKQTTLVRPPPPIALKEAQELISQGKMDLLMEKVIGNFQVMTRQSDIIIVEGLVPDQNETYTGRLNVELAKNLNADVILVAAPEQKTATELDAHLELASGIFASRDAPNVVGCILNKVGEPAEWSPHKMSLDHNYIQSVDYASQCKFFGKNNIKLVGNIHWKIELVSLRTSDLMNQLNARIINIGEASTRRILSISICARTVPNMLHALNPGCLIITPSDRTDIILVACMAALNGVPLAGLLLTGNFEPDQKVMTLCQQAMLSGLPVLKTEQDTYDTAHALNQLNREVPIDDLDRIERVMTEIASSLDIEWLKQQCAKERATRMSPPAFRFQLSERARQANKTIVLPEGNEPRTVSAASICHNRGLAKCVLIGDKNDIKNVAAAQGIELPADIVIINPDDVRERYVAPMVELRKHKDLTPQMAIAMLEDNVVLATMMVALDEVDGLVSGAVHSTANTVRPALQLIKTHPGAKIVSSVFFMCLPEQVLVYGDCAINPDPTAEQLADIALQSADSALAFGIEPRVAMISYSTGISGSGEDVDKVREATRLAKEKRPDLLIDGPLQYDAAAIKSVAKTKAPDSKVAGNATVFIFPDLNTGNTTYKAVQRSANVVSIGPMLQGLRKPVNDLSRGALVEDIVFTIALTAVQAQQVAAAAKQNPTV